MAKRGRPKKENPYTETRSIRFSREQIAKLEAEAKRQRQDTGDIIHVTDIIRAYVDSLPTPEDTEDSHQKAA